MPIKELALNNDGLYLVQSRATSQSSAVEKQTSSARDTDGLQKLHQVEETQAALIPENLKPDFEAIHDSMSLRKFNFFIENSKYLHKLIAAEGVIDQITTLAVLNPYKADFFDEKGWGVDSEPIPYGGEHKYSVKNEMRNEDLVKDGSLVLMKDYAQRIIDGDFEGSLLIKPEQSANGDGQIRLKYEDGKLTLRVYNSQKGFDSRVYLCRSSLIEMHCKDLDALKQISDDEVDPRVFEIDLSNKAQAKEAITEILQAVTSTSYNEEVNGWGASIEELPGVGLHQSADSALAEPELNLLKLDGQIIEGRFFLGMGLDGQIYFTTGSKWSDAQYRRIPSPSFLKMGKENSDMVNIGEQGKEWPAMSKDIIKATGKDINQREFEAYMETLLRTQYLHMGRRIVDLGIRIKTPLQMDIAWDATQTVKIPKQFSEGYIEVPRPILIEWNSDQGY